MARRANGRKGWLEGRREKTGRYGSGGVSISLLLFFFPLVLLLAMPSEHQKNLTTQ
jgi:hypothetical protein